MIKTNHGLAFLAQIIEVTFSQQLNTSIPTLLKLLKCSTFESESVKEGPTSGCGFSTAACVYLAVLRVLSWYIPNPYTSLLKQACYSKSGSIQTQNAGNCILSHNALHITGK